MTESGETRDLIANLRAVLRLISPDHITPIGVRQIENVLSAHEEQEAQEEPVQETAVDLMTFGAYECPGTKFPDGTHCGEYGWHAKDCPMRREESTEAE